MQSSVSQTSVWTHKRHFVCYVHAQPTVLYVNAHFDESKGGIHQVNQLLARIQHSVECPSNTQLKS